jgi:hypothetical protein
MSNPTSNYFFQMPTSTDLVTDLPADFEVFGQAVDTQMKTNADAATQKATLTTTGDVYYASAANTPARLGIGSTGDVLTVAGGIPSWAAPSGGGTSWSLLNAGGTALTGAQTVTVSGISGADKIMVLIAGASSASASSLIGVRINTDTGTNYYPFGGYVLPAAAYAVTLTRTVQAAEAYIRVGVMSSNAASIVSGAVLIDGTNSSGVKIFNVHGSADAPGGANQHGALGIGGYWNSASTVTSISVYSDTGNLDAGTVYIFTSA